MPVCDKSVVAVKVSHDGFQQVCTLNEALADILPLAFMDHDWHVAQRPCALDRSGRAILAEEDAFILKVLIAERKPPRAVLV